MRLLSLVLTVSLAASSACYAGKADVLDVKIEKTEDGYFNVATTVQHDDDGWEHYADRWEILDENGVVLDTRVLQHPHSPAPFVRTMPRARIHGDMGKIIVRAHDNLHGYGGKTVEAIIPKK